MKRTMSKVFASLLAVLMLTGMVSISAFAAGVAPEKGTLVVHKYKLTPDEMSDNDGIPGTGVELPSPGPEFETLDGITFNVYPVELEDGQAYPAPGALTLDDYAAPTGFTDIAGAEFELGAVAGSQTTADGGVATFADLPQGIYLVVEQVSTLVDVPAAPFVVMVPMTSPEGDDWMETVHVYPKNEKLSFDKTVVQPSVAVGDPIVWTLTPQLPSDIDSIQLNESDSTKSTYVITDDLDASLDFVSVGEIKMGTSTINKENGDAVVFTDSGNTLLAGTDYIVTPDEATTDGPEVTITLTAAGLAKLKDGNYTCLQFDINTTVNDGILESGSISNQAELDFTNKYGEDKNIKSKDPDDEVDDGTDIHTAFIDLTKVDARDADEKLDGAQFKIASSLANAKAGNFLMINPTTKVIYDVGDDGYKDGATPDEDAIDYEITTDASGVAGFDGLVDYTVGEDGTITYNSYYLVETKAPEGYNLVSAPIEVTFDATTSAGEDPTYTKAVTVKNNQGFTLPFTGGNGTILFIVVGIVLLGGAVLLFVVAGKKTRKAANK